MKLEGLPADFSEVAKFDREKGYTPVRVTFISEEDQMELFRFWPEGRIPSDYKETEDIDAEGKYNPEIFEATNSPINLDEPSESPVRDTDSDDVPDFIDGPLIEF